jgi:hypothetical protein
MVLADTLQKVLGLTVIGIQAFIRHETTFTWSALTSADRCLSIQRKVPATSTNQLQKYEGPLLGRVSSVSSAYARVGIKACWDFWGSRLPRVDTIFEVSSAKEALLRDPPGGKHLRPFSARVRECIICLRSGRRFGISAGKVANGCHLQANWNKFWAFSCAGLHWQHDPSVLT